MTHTKHNTAGPTLTGASFQRFASFVTRELGIKMPEGKISMLQGRLQRRLRALGMDSVDEYQKHLFEGGTDELVHFIDAVTTNKTDFFREPRHFEYLTRRALPSLDRQPLQPWQARAWCAGCSSGEEVYTLAMSLSEFGRERERFDFSIIAMDISTRMLDHGRQAIYDESRIEPVPMELRKRYLLRSRDPSQQRVRIVPQLRQKAAFKRLNFMDADYRIKEVFDVIFFRNVMIYFDKPTQEAVINKLCRNLRSGGYLFVGHSESLAGLDIPVESVGSAIYRKGM